MRTALRPRVRTPSMRSLGRRLARVEGASHNALLHARPVDHRSAPGGGPADGERPGRHLDRLQRRGLRLGAVGEGAPRGRSHIPHALGHRVHPAGLRGWGIDGLLARLRGMFAFAILDTRKARLISRADRMGEKPLSTAARAASCLSARWCAPCCPSCRRTSAAFRRKPIDCLSGAPLYSGAAHGVHHIQRLENGHYLELDLGTRS